MSDALLAEALPASDSEDGKHIGFDSLPIGTELLKSIAAMGFVTPTDVQAACIELALKRGDLVVQAETGSGKTCAFGIPLVERLEPGAAIPGQPAALILTPTRELANQVATELRALASHRGTRILAVYGGVPMGRQIAGLRAGADIVVGTPGRLLDHIRRKNLTLEALDAVVLDEADEMLSMGFWDDVTDLLKMAPDGKQTMLFSATLPYQVAQAAATFLKEPARVDVSGDKLTVEGITNTIVHVVPERPKPRQLLYLLETEQPESAIIFCNTRNETDMISKYLTQAGFVAEPLSGNFKQKERERVMARIKSGELRYMVATDVAARGIDVEDLSHVVNYSLPEFSEVYLHRVGRTGRAGKCGTAISLVDGRGLGTLSVLERQFGISFDELVLPDEGEILRRRSDRIMKELSERASVAEVGQHLPVAKNILEAADGQQVVAFLLKQFFASQADPDRKGGSADREAPQETATSGASSGGGSGSGGRTGNGASADGNGSTDGRRRSRRRRRRRRGKEPGGTATDIVDAADVLANGGGEGRAEGTSGGAGNGSGTGNGGAVDSQPGYRRVRVNIGFDDGFKGRGAVAKKISALAGLTEGSVTELEARRDHAVLKATAEIADLVVERVDGAQIGKKVVTVSVAG